MDASEPDAGAESSGAAVEDPILADLTPEQADAVRSVEGPLIVVAGPGSGKTRVITRRIAYLVSRCGVPPWHVLAITFTNKAADEMRSRVDRLLGRDSGVLVATFHGFCARMLRRYGPIERTPGFAIYDEDDQRSCMKRILRELKVDEQRWRPGHFLGRISAAKNALEGPADLDQRAHDFAARLLAQVYLRYEEMLAEFDALDFDDLLLQMLRVIEERPGVRQALRERFRYVLVDEYQDTNRPQFLIANAIAGEDGNLCVVGDPDQSIYRWRGADVRNILEFEKVHPHAREIRLERNYRSTKRILLAAQRLIENNVERRQRTLWTANPEGEPLRIVRLLTDDDEARFIARSIEQRLEEGVPPAELAVFYRTNALSRKFEEELRGRGVRHVVVGAVPFYQRKEVKDVLAYLRLNANPRDEQQVRRTIALAEGFGGTTLKRVEAFSERCGLTLLEGVRRVREIAEIQGRQRRAVEDYVALLDALAALPPAPVAPLVREVVERTGYRRKLAGSDDPQDWSRAENVEALVNAAGEFDERHPEATYKDFLDQVALLSATDQERDEPTSVRLMTLHAAKGLEFDEVFIAGCDQSLLPLERQEEACDLEEERRLLYVGITRARRAVTITTVAFRRTYGDERRSAPSRFLSEIPQEVTERLGSLAPHFEVDPDEELARGVPLDRLYERVRPGASGHGGIPWPSGAPGIAGAAGSRRAEPVGFAPGDRVEHAVFGLGDVVEMQGSGPACRVVVRFDRVGEKTLVLRYANLRPLEQE